jgi:hypothetical protein
MTAVVRLFSHAGVTSAAVNPAAGRYTSDSVSMLILPYIARESVTASGTAQSTTTTLTTNSATKLVHVQVQPGKTVAIEANPPNRSTEADTSSPYYAGEVTFAAGPNWVFSILDVTS